MTGKNCDVFWGRRHSDFQQCILLSVIESNLLLFLFKSCKMQIRGQAKFSQFRISDVEMSLT